MRQRATRSVEDFFYGPSGQLLSERSFTFAQNSTGNTVDEYIWLNGQPIASIRTYFTADMLRTSDWRGFNSEDGEVCPRRNENARCGLSWLTPDRWGRPTLVTDINHRISGVGEYEVFGVMNRVEVQSETPHPIAANGSYQLASGLTREKYRMGLRARVRASFVDTEITQPCGSFAQCVGSVALSVSSGATSLFSTLAIGHHGPLVSDWFDASLPFDVRFFFARGGDGAVLRSWEYQRVSAPDGTPFSALPYFPPLRFPGQYYDEETDLHENWNRFYDATQGRYLSREPLLQSSRFVLGMAEAGMSVPAYSYAANNPVKYVDPSGRNVVLPPAASQSGTFKTALRQYLASDTGRATYSEMQQSPISYIFSEYSSRTEQGGFTVVDLANNQVEINLNVASTSGTPFWVNLAHEVGHGRRTLCGSDARRPNVDWQAERWPSIAGAIGDPRPYSGEEWAAWEFAAQVASEVPLSIAWPWSPVSPASFRK